MPTYKNLKTDRTDVALGGHTIPYGQSKAMLEFYSPLPNGITQTAVAPVWNPILHSSVEVGNSADDVTVTLPSVGASAEGGYIDISLNCIAGTVSVYFNDKTAFVPPLLMTAGEWILIKASLTQVAFIILSFTAASSSIKVDVFQR